uniref:Uncharacterized protein TCIL3000_10_8630 n=1 Tax=Trypanosoma congolense (strain IL3000) TaxID=1068625 RepID=G0UXH0_TRYCI|nr:unnamed protein product [Trypanosoma congolense IL3000]
MLHVDVVEEQPHTAQRSSESIGSGSTGMSLSLNPKLITHRTSGVCVSDVNSLGLLSIMPSLSPNLLDIDRALPPKYKNRRVWRAPLTPGRGNSSRYCGSQRGNLSPLEKTVNSSISQAPREPARFAHSARYNHVASVVKELIEGRITPHEARHASSNRAKDQESFRTTPSARGRFSGRHASGPQRFNRSCHTTASFVSRPRSLTPAATRGPDNPREFVSRSTTSRSAITPRYVSPRWPSAPLAVGGQRPRNSTHNTSPPRWCATTGAKTLKPSAKSMAPYSPSTTVRQNASPTANAQKSSPRQNVKINKVEAQQPAKEVRKACGLSGQTKRNDFFMLRIHSKVPTGTPKSSSRVKASSGGTRDVGDTRTANAPTSASLRWRGSSSRDRSSATNEMAVSVSIGGGVSHTARAHHEHLSRSERVTVSEERGVQPLLLFDVEPPRLAAKKDVPVPAC